VRVAQLQKPEDLTCLIISIDGGYDWILATKEVIYDAPSYVRWVIIQMISIANNGVFSDFEIYQALVENGEVNAAIAYVQRHGRKVERVFEDIYNSIVAINQAYS